MKLKLLDYSRTEFGLFYIGVEITNEEKQPKAYTYVLGSDYFFRKFLKLYKTKRTHCQALALLNKNKIELIVD